MLLDPVVSGAQVPLAVGREVGVLPPDPSPPLLLLPPEPLELPELPELPVRPELLPLEPELPPLEPPLPPPDPEEEVDPELLFEPLEPLEPLEPELPWSPPLLLEPLPGSSGVPVDAPPQARTVLNPTKPRARRMQLLLNAGPRGPEE